MVAELHALDHAPIPDVEAWDDPLAQHAQCLGQREAILIERLADDGAGRARGLQRAQVVEAGDAARSLHRQLRIERVDFPIEPDIRPRQQAVARDVGAEQMAQIGGAVFVDHFEQRLASILLPAMCRDVPAAVVGLHVERRARRGRVQSGRAGSRPGQYW